MLETQAERIFGHGIVGRGWRGPVLDAAVLDRHYDPQREGRRTLGALCEVYGVDLGHAHDACADAMASIGVLCALAERHVELRDGDPTLLHRAQVGWHREWVHACDERRLSEGLGRVDPRDAAWPVAPRIAPAA
jgi:DNA polymerase-3 subunit epsilon